MTEETATRAASLLNEIRWSKETIHRLKDERAAKPTGLDPDAPGPKHHVLDTLSKEWPLIGGKCVAFFIKAMDDVIVREENYLKSLEKELERL